MMRWLAWFVLVPLGYVLGGVWRDSGLPAVDVGVVLAVWMVLFADRAVLPWLLLGAALGRAVVDEASLAVQILVVGVPVAVMVPLRGLVSAQHWLWQVLVAVACAVCEPKLAGLCGRVFDQPSVGANLLAMDVVAAAVLVPPAVWLLRRLPPLRAFAERSP